jgi:hypothetical protein
MKKKYEKPEIYSEKLAIDTLRAQTCEEQNNAPAQEWVVPGMPWCGVTTCDIFENGPSL